MFPFTKGLRGVMENISRDVALPRLYFNRTIGVLLERVGYTDVGSPDAGGAGQEVWTTVD